MIVPWISELYIFSTYLSHRFNKKSSWKCEDLQKGLLM